MEGTKPQKYNSPEDNLIKTDDNPTKTKENKRDTCTGIIID